MEIKVKLLISYFVFWLLIAVLFVDMIDITELSDVKFGIVLVLAFVQSNSINTQRIMDKIGVE